MAQISFINVNKDFGGTRVIRDFNLEAEDGALIVLVGPSGCGKSTLLRMAAGLEAVTGGDIRINGKTVNALSPQARNVAMVFQNYALYPHMTVRDNLAFPLKMKGLKKDQIAAKVSEAARLLDLEPLLDRKPRKLSGGQQQRVAMGRAIVRDPSVFLMDEPLSNLDAKLRVQIRSEISELQRRMKTTMIYVTHDQAEALTLGDRVVVLKDGQIQQAADSRTLYEWPANAFVAGFIGSPGMNLLPARLEINESVRVKLGGAMLPVPAERVAQFAGLSEFAGRKVLLGLRPEAFGAADAFPEDRRISIRVQTAEMLGHETLLYGKVQTDDNIPSIVARLDPSVHAEAGDAMQLGVDTGSAHFFHPESQGRL